MMYLIEIKILTGASENWKYGRLHFYHLIHTILNENNSIVFKIKAQIEDSALSMSSNIAEGYSRRSIKEMLRFNEIALSSAAENYSQLYCLFITNQVSEELFRKYDDLLYRFENKTISMNKTLINKINNGDEWKNEY